MKFFVVVNDQYLVLTDAQTATDAEILIQTDYPHYVNKCQGLSITDVDAIFEASRNLSTISLMQLNMLDLKKRISIQLDAAATHEAAANKAREQLEGLKNMLV